MVVDAPGRRPLLWLKGGLVGVIGRREDQAVDRAYALGEVVAIQVGPAERLLAAGAGDHQAVQALRGAGGMVQGPQGHGARVGGGTGDVFLGERAILWARVGTGPVRTLPADHDVTGEAPGYEFLVVRRELSGRRWQNGELRRRPRRRLGALPLSVVPPVLPDGMLQLVIPRLGGRVAPSASGIGAVVGGVPGWRWSGRGISF